MAIKTFKPYTPSRRGYTVTDYSVLSKDPPEKSLLKYIKKWSGRNNAGRVSLAHRGGANRRKYRIIDFQRVREEQADVVALQYDPNRSAFIALVEYADKTKSYIVAPDALKVGDSINCGKGAQIRPGNTLNVEDIPDGTFIHNIEMRPNTKAKLARAAGASAQLMGKEIDKHRVIVRLPSGEMRYIPTGCKATIGRVSNTDHENVKLGKAGRRTYRGFRPASRGTVQNPCDHPHGGGEGRSKCAGRAPCSRTGVIAKGFRTRSKSKANSHLVKDRRSR